MESERLAGFKTDLMSVSLSFFYGYLFDSFFPSAEREHPSKRNFTRNEIRFAQELSLARLPVYSSPYVGRILRACVYYASLIVSERRGNAYRQQIAFIFLLLLLAVIGHERQTRDRSNTIGALPKGDKYVYRRTRKYQKIQKKKKMKRMIERKEAR